MLSDQELAELYYEMPLGKTLNPGHIRRLRAIADAAIAEVRVVPESEIDKDGFTNFLVKNDDGMWWVTTTKNGEPFSGMPLDYFLSVGGPR